VSTPPLYTNDASPRRGGVRVPNYLAGIIHAIGERMFPPRVPMSLITPHRQKKAEFENLVVGIACHLTEAFTNWLS